MFQPVLVAILLLAFSPAWGADPYDVVVYGSTPGGVAAALAAAREGASVVLLEQKHHIGGLSTSGLTNAEISHLDQRTLGGICREFFTRLGKEYGLSEPVWRWESHKAQWVFDTMVGQAGLLVSYQQLIEKFEKGDSPAARIDRIVMTDGSAYSGRVFIDATYEGDLMARTGVRYIVGRESYGQYDESLAGIRLIDQPIDVSPYDDNGQLLYFLGQRSARAQGVARGGASVGPDQG